MACCGQKTNTDGSTVAEIGMQICRVCQLVDKDNSIKQCTYCPACSHWICTDCMPEIHKRGFAMAIEFGQKFRNLFKIK